MESSVFGCQPDLSSSSRSFDFPCLLLLFAHVFL
jgi:hypothetical protein